MSAPATFATAAGLDADTERYAFVETNRFIRVADDPRSTFSVDVDTASYANVRRFLQDGQLPPAGAVRVEELVNAFSYAYPRPTGPEPVAVTIEAAACPWNPSHRLVRIALAGRVVEAPARPPANVVFLVDVSGSMMAPDKLPLVRQALRMFAASLGARDRVALTVYAGAAGTVLAPTSGADRAAIEEAIEQLQAGGSTNGAAGIRLAYGLARDGFIRGGVNRVVLATDGDFNVGTASDDELVRLVESEAKAGVFLTVLGVGRGNLNDAMLDAVTRRGNGQYVYLDSLQEARRALVEQAGGTLVTIAKDVKIQVEFNPAAVAAYRLIGYETRVLGHEEFNDDRRDAGDMGSGHTVTAFYEVVPAGARIPGAAPPVDPLKYQANGRTPSPSSSELVTVKVRYKDPDGEISRLLEVPFRDSGAATASADFTFAAGVAAFGLALRAADGQSDRYDGQSDLYDSQSDRYDGRSALDDGQSVLGDGQSALDAGLDAGMIRRLLEAGAGGPEPERRREIVALCEIWQSLSTAAIVRSR